MGRQQPRVRRVYDPPEAADGLRVLVDRLWPRGLTKERAEVDEWPKDLTPSNELRRWYHADKDARREEFADRYRGELAAPAAQEALAHLREEVAKGPVTLVTANKDLTHSHVPVLVEELSH
ncbi:DUF488 domain-containing protein [Streptacidiphilus monticola]|jgi:uncharacterized protein YeaO (DUF488 family)|uniref:DUF488 domain-containing protein n=1 Tax=Streptacidiphilus monticola TaxID=2161674 RepID=A0ABW1G852_9ACTN